MANVVSKSCKKGCKPMDCKCKASMLHKDTDTPEWLVYERVAYNLEEAHSWPAHQKYNHPSMDESTTVDKEGRFVRRNIKDTYQAPWQVNRPDKGMGGGTPDDQAQEFASLSGQRRHSTTLTAVPGDLNNYAKPHEYESQNNTESSQASGSDSESGGTTTDGDDDDNASDGDGGNADKNKTVAATKSTKAAAAAGGGVGPSAKADPAVASAKDAGDAGNTSATGVTDADESPRGATSGGGSAAVAKYLDDEEESAW